MSEDAVLDKLELSDEARKLFETLLEEKRDVEKDRADLREKERKQTIDARIEELKGMGFEQHPGFLKKVRSIYLSDDGEAALLLSEEGAKSTLTATEIVDSLIDSLPKEDGKVKLSEQVLETGNDKKPPVDTTDELSDEERAKNAREFLGLAEPVKSK